MLDLQQTEFGVLRVSGLGLVAGIGGVASFETRNTDLARLTKDLIARGAVSREGVHKE